MPPQIPGLIFKTPQTEEEQSFLDRLGGLGGVLGGGIRAISGMASAGGHLPGALISGGGEVAAELAEGSAFNPPVAPPDSWLGRLQTSITTPTEDESGLKRWTKGFAAGALAPAARIGAAAVTGAVPFGAVLKEGRPIASAIRGAAYSGGGEALREAATGQDIDPTAVGTSAAIGGGITGALAKLFGVKPTPPPDTRFVVEPTHRGTTPGKLGAGMGKPRPIKGTGEVIPVAGEAPPESTLTTPYGAAEPAPYRAEARRTVAAEAKAAKEAKKAQEAADRQAEIERIRAEQGMRPGTPSSADSISVTTPEGTSRVTIPYAKPKPQGGGPQVPPEPATPPRPSVPQPPKVDVAAQVPPEARLPFDPEADLRSRLAGYGEGGIMPESMRPTELELMPEGPVVSPTPKTPPVEPEAQSTLAKFFKTPGGAAGYNYRLAKEAEKAGEIPTANFAREARLREVEAAKTGVPTTGAAPKGAEPTAPDWVNEQLGLIDRLKNLGKGETTLGSGLGGLQNILGAAARNPEFTARLGLGVGGAVMGGMLDPLGNPLLSAAAGGLAGAALPSGINMLRNMGVPGHLLENLQEKTATPEGIQDAAHRIWRALPNLQRFNYLMSGHGLAANAFVGPYGSGLKAALEHGLSGDSRGWGVLNELKNPMNFLREYKGALDEAKELVTHGEMGRAEGLGAGEGATRLERAFATPGTALTAGDVAMRRILVRNGFSDEEARAITLTSEPWNKFSKSVVNVGRSGTIGGTMLPFSRTTMNVMEQGAERFPGLGFLVHSAKEKAGGPSMDFWPQFVQQLIAAGETGVGYGVGSNVDPETAKTARRYLSNFGGQYAIFPSIGMAAGQLARAGKTVPEQIRGGLVAGVKGTPLPSTQTIEDVIGAATGSGKIPTGMYPGAFREDPLKSIFLPSKAKTTMPVIPGIVWK